jgi:biopolymer transport protein ExbD
VRGDKNVTYGKVIEAMGKINGAGFTKVALVSEAPSGPAPVKAGAAGAK